MTASNLAVAGRVSFVSIVARFEWPKLQSQEANFLGEKPNSSPIPTPKNHVVNPVPETMFPSV